jgi:hypothetical protein
VAKPNSEKISDAHGERLNDIVKSGRVNTSVQTQTVVEDRTENPEVRPMVEYEAEHQELDGGTMLTTYMHPVGGFPGEEQADA